MAASPQDTKIVRASIHPAIGIARLGNSEADYFLGPQVLEPPAQPLGFYRDAKGALKRQAVQFRLYGYNASGDVVREITAGMADIRWGVHLANRKAAWHQWAIALDIPEAGTTQVAARNPAADTADARARLVIDAGLQEVAGGDASPVACIGQFQDVPVYLGEVSTDKDGRLLVQPGRGVSASPTGSPIFVEGPNAFGNSDGWFDDIADGPVTAQIRIDGREIEVEPAWVVSAPPNYAPAVKGLRTLFDLLQDLFISAGWRAKSAGTSFTRDVYPVLKRLTDQQWVNQAYAVEFGYNGVFDFTDPVIVVRLHTKAASPTDDPNREYRRVVFNHFRSPEAADGNQLPWPWVYGDAMDIPAGRSPRQNASISLLQYEALHAWAEGDFDDDWGSVTSPRRIDDVALADQPEMLDRAALEFCLADAFHPGCEVTWPIRHLSIYSKPFRIRHGSASPIDAPAGAMLDQAKALGETGPLHEQGPGTLTRWMALPWQADTAWCRSAYDQTYDEFAPSFWPARVPNHVLSAEDFEKAIDPGQPLSARVQAFAIRTNWNAPLGEDTAGAMTEMVRVFGSMGLLEERAGPSGGDAIVPEKMLVASFGPDVTTVAVTTAAAGQGVVPPQRVLAHGPNFSSPKAGRAAPLPVRRPPG